MSVTKKKKQENYSLKSDGSPEMIEYRNKVNRGEVKKRGRPFLTAEQRAESKRKRKEYLQTYNARRKRKKRHWMDFYTYEEAKQRIQAEGVKSSGEYMDWYKLSHPARMPSSPEDHYKRKGTWVNWNDFLGNNNTYPYFPKKRFRPYKEAKAYAHSKGFATVPEWIAFCKAGNVPEDIPHRPDVAYYKTGDWFSWREFLGPKCKLEMGKAIQDIAEHVLYILQVPHPTLRLYRIGVTVGGQSSIDDAVRKNNLRFIDSYIIEKDFDWKSFIAGYGEEDWERPGTYSIKNINDLIFDLSRYFIKYRSE